MKCILCEGKLEEKTVEYSELGILLGKFKGLTCTKCNETFFNAETADKIQQKSKELGLFGLNKKTRVAQVGNSLAIRIPKEIADFVHLQKEGEVKIFPKNKSQIIIEIKT